MNDVPVTLEGVQFAAERLGRINLFRLSLIDDDFGDLSGLGSIRFLRRLHGSVINKGRLILDGLRRGGLGHVRPAFC